MDPTRSRPRRVAVPAAASVRFLAQGTWSALGRPGRGQVRRADASPDWPPLALETLTSVHWSLLDESSRSNFRGARRHLSWDATPFSGCVPQPWWVALRSDSRRALLVVARQAVGHLAAGNPVLSARGGGRGSGPVCRGCIF